VDIRGGAREQLDLQVELLDLRTARRNTSAP
jgi:hypothetical protein